MVERPRSASPGPAERVARFRAARRDPDRAVLEGFHAVKHALRFGARVDELVTPDPAALDALAARLAPDLRGALAARVERVPRALFRQLAPRPPATGLMALAARRPARAEAILEAPRRAPAVLLDHPRHAGNLGAAVRVAAAAGAAGLVAVGPADPWAPAALRGAAGLQYALPVARCDGVPGWRGPLVALQPEGEPLGAERLPANAVLAFGTERHGLDPGLRARADLRVRIPMEPGVASLNLATAVAVALYAWRLAGAGRDRAAGEGDGERDPACA